MRDKPYAVVHVKGLPMKQIAIFLIGSAAAMVMMVVGSYLLLVPRQLASSRALQVDAGSLTTSDAGSILTTTGWVIPPEALVFDQDFILSIADQATELCHVSATGAIGGVKPEVCRCYLVLVDAGVRLTLFP
jgi:hypothetical protein